MYNLITLRFQKMWMLHPILVLLFFLIHETNEGNSSEVKYIFVFILIVIIISLFVLWVNKTWNKNIFVSSYLLSIMLISCLFFRYLIDISGFRITTLCVYILIIYLILFLSSKKLTRQYLKLNLFLNILFLLLTTIEFAKFCQFSIKNNKVMSVVANNNHWSKPNVYFLMLDGYAKNRNLKTYWNYNNSNFTNSLKKQGFYNIEDSHTDYNLTIETVTSMFTSEKVISSASLSSSAEKQRNASQLENKLRNKSVVIKKFQKNGYDFYNFFVTVIDNINSQQYPFASNSIYKNSIYQVILQGIGWTNSFFIIQSDLDRIEEVRKISKLQINRKQPSFIYFHMMSTHFPFCLNEKQEFVFYENPKIFGEYIMSLTENIKFHMNVESKKDFMIWRYRYINHLIKINQLVIPLIEFIRKSDPNAILVVASDHGSRILCDVGFDEARKESFENISYVYFPDKDYSKLSQIMTPTDLMKVVQMKCIGQ